MGLQVVVAMGHQEVAALRGVADTDPQVARQANPQAGVPMAHLQVHLRGPMVRLRAHLRGHLPQAHPLRRVARRARCHSSWESAAASC